jgi:hypothetical protein
MGKVLNHYRPELHYMRGPGPKWLEKHGSQTESNGEGCRAWDGELARAKGWREVILARLRALNERCA